MKRLLLILASTFFIFLLYFFVSPNTNHALAQTCSSLGYDCGYIVNPVSGTSTPCGNNGSCADTTLTCNNNKCVAQTCSSLGYDCGYIVNPVSGTSTPCGNNGSCTDTTLACANNKCIAKTCSNQGFECGYIVNPVSGTSTPCGNNGSCTDTTKTCSNNKCIVPPVCTQGTCRTYSSADVNNGCGKVETPGEWCDSHHVQICCYPGTSGGGGAATAEPNPDCGYPNCNLPQGGHALPCTGGSCDTAVGSINTTAQGFATSIFAVVLSLVGGIAILLIIISGYKLMASRGNPEGIQGAREQLTAAIVGLMFVIFALVILQIIGVNLLKLPGFTP